MVLPSLTMSERHLFESMNILRSHTLKQCSHIHRQVLEPDRHSRSRAWQPCYPLLRMPRKPVAARRYFISGRVQGVGYRYFAQHHADRLGVRGYTRNLDDGRVEVYAVASPELLSEYFALLHQGPRWADVRHVEEQEAAVQQYGSFQIEA